MLNKVKQIGIFMLEKINYPQDLKKLNIHELHELCEDIRNAIIDSTNKNGGHLASSLGAVEIIVAMHYVFDAPNDKFIFDVGHQAYAHKLITGRKDKFDLLRKKDGVSGFPNHRESEYDTFDAGHSSSSISSALGVARARDNKKEDYHVVSLIGDGAIGGGMSLEALNDLGNQPYSKFIIILNDNEMSISKNVGALSKHFAKLRAAKGYITSKKKIKNALDKINQSGKLSYFVKHLRNTLRYLLIGENIFDSMNITYLGPINGHSLTELIDIFEKVKNSSMPVLVHTVTSKGRGHDKAEENPEKYHGVSPENKDKQVLKNYNKVFGETLTELSEFDDRICAVTAGMTLNTGLNEFSERYPQRFFDTGIAEQHALAMAGGLAKGGMKPFVVIYSTFLQRGFDQIFHDICLQEVPVTICIDHAGLAGEDGATHQGIYDLAFLRSMPGLIILHPRDTQEFARMLKYAANCDKPVAIRYPKGNAPVLKGENDFDLLKWDYLRHGSNGTILSFGICIETAIEVAEKFDLAVVDARTLKPLDENVLTEIKDKPIVVIEDNASAGGLCESVLNFYAQNKINTRVYGFSLKDEFINVGTVNEQLIDNCIDAKSIIKKLENEIR